MTNRPPPPGLTVYGGKSDRDKRLETLEDNVEQLLDAYKKNKKFSREFLYYAINIVMLTMLILTPVLAIIGNVGGAVVLGLFAVTYFIITTIAKLVAAGYMASIDAEAEVTLQRERNSLERIGGAKGTR